MRVLAGATLALIAGTLIVGWALGQRGSPWGPRLSFIRRAVAQAAASFFLAWYAVRAATFGGPWWWALALSLALLALTSAALFLLFAFGAIKHGVDPVAERGGYQPPR